MAETATCPLCAEAIEPGVDRCRHCGHSFLEPEGRCSPAEAAAIRREIDRDLRLGVAGITLGLGLLAVPAVAFPLVVGAGTPGALRWAVVAMQSAQLASLVCLAGGIGLCARSRGRSLGWALLGLLGCLGLPVVLLLAKFCRRCGAQGGLTGSVCAGCDAPL